MISKVFTSHNCPLGIAHTQDTHAWWLHFPFTVTDLYNTIGVAHFLHVYMWHTYIGISTQRSLKMRHLPPIHCLLGCCPCLAYQTHDSKYKLVTSQAFTPSTYLFVLIIMLEQMVKWSLSPSVLGTSNAQRAIAWGKYIKNLCFICPLPFISLFIIMAELASSPQSHALILEIVCIILVHTDGML